MCKLLVPDVERQTGIHQVDMFTVEYGTVFIDLMNIKYLHSLAHNVSHVGVDSVQNVEGDL